MPKTGLIYRGSADGTVWVGGEMLPPRFDLRRHSPTGFNWGYWGSGPAQLALALLAHHLDDDKMAMSLYQDFKFQVIAKLPFRQEWELTSEQIQEAVERIQQDALCDCVCRRQSDNVAL